MVRKKSEFIGIDHQAIFDASRDATFILSSSGRILDVNRTALERYGYSLQEFKQMTVSDLLPADLKPRVAAKLKKTLKSSQTFEWRHRRKDGSELPVEVYVQPIIVKGEPILLSRVRDISQNKIIESELQNKQHLLERILEAEPGAVYIYDLVRKLNVYVNRHWLSAYGYNDEETQEMAAGLVSIFHPDDLHRISASHDALRSAADGETRLTEYRIQDKQGGWHWLMSRETPFTRDKDGLVSQILGITHDITERKQTEALVIGQKHVLEMIAAGTSLPETLTALVRLIEDQSPGMIGSILLLDADGIHVRHGAAPNLPAEFVAAIDGQPIGPVAGSCGTAAYRKEAVFVEDIATDPLWKDYKAVALPHGLRACWSTPIMDNQGKVLGTFAMYYRMPRSPEAEHLHLTEIVSHIAGIAISRHRGEKQLADSQARLIKAQQVTHMGFLEWNLKTNMIFCSDEIYSMYGIDRDVTYTTPEFIKMIVHPDDINYVQENLDLALRRVKNYDIDHRIKRIDGNIRWVHAQAELVNEANGNGEVLLGTVVDITERKNAEHKVQRLTRLYAALSQCNQSIVRCTSEAELFPQICRDAVNFGGMKMTWIGMLDTESKLVKQVASYGTGTEYLDTIGISLDPDSPSRMGPTARTISEDRPFWIQDFKTDPATAPWHERAAKFQWGAVATLPLHRSGAVVGVLGLYSGDAGAFDDAMQELLVEMAMDISYALDHFASEAERKRSEKALQLSEHHMRTIIETEPECVKIIGGNGKLLEMNAAGLAMLEVDSLEEARQHSLMELILPEYRDSFKALHQRVMTGEKASLEFELRGVRGTNRWLETNAAPLRDSNGKVTSLLGITRDITERKVAEQRITFLANFDALTGLPNRAQLDSHLKYALSLVKRSNGNLAVMFIDIDHFKDINDTLGHTIGDTLLIEVAKRLQSVLREEDTASRLGGDEFMLILPGADARGAAQVAQKLLQVVAEPCQIEQHDLVVTASIGIALYPNDGNNLESLSKSADTAMYRAKQEGRNGYRFFTPAMQARTARNMQLVNALRQALELDQFELHYQPQVTIPDRRIIGVETLLRWRHPELGNVSPAEFIPVAEDSGLILPIGEWVLRTAVKQLKRWMDSGYAPFVVAVNLSAVQFRHPSLPELVSSILEEAQLPGKYLELELTEGVTMHDPQRAIAIMDNLHERGIRMSIDDFGTGYSSLNYLKKFKAYKLKIDQSFVRDISTDLEDKAIVGAIISMSGNLGLQTIAEGVETAEQLAYLVEQGCDEAQGYFFSKPLTAADLEPLIARGTL